MNNTMKINSLMKKHFVDAKNVAVVGFSHDKLKIAHTVPKYLTNFYNVIPINPYHEYISGLKAYPDVIEMDKAGEMADIVNIFRPSKDCLSIVEQVVSMTNLPKLIWLQLGIKNSEAKELAEKYNIDFIEDKCIYVEHRDLMK